MILTISVVIIGAKYSSKVVDSTERKTGNFWKMKINELESNAVEEYRSLTKRHKWI